MNTTITKLRFQALLVVLATILTACYVGAHTNALAGVAAALVTGNALAYHLLVTGNPLLGVTTKTFHQLPQESAPFNRLLLIKPVTDLTETVATTAQEFRATIPANTRLRDVLLVLPNGLGDASDTAFDDITLTVGDSGGTSRFIPSTQIAALNVAPVLIAAAGGAANLTATVGTDIAALTAIATTAIATADAATQSGSYVQADVQTIATLANAIKAKFNTLITNLGTLLTELGTIRTFINANKADIAALSAVADTDKVYTAADYLKVVVTPESGKSLSNLDQGEIRIYARLEQVGNLG